MPGYMRLFDIVGLVIVTLIIAVLGYDLIAAWFAPRCKTPSELDVGWCLPIGWEGPFADVWSNRSLVNTRMSATTNIAVAGLAVGYAAYSMVTRHRHARAIAYATGFAVLIFLILRSMLLDHRS